MTSHSDPGKAPADKIVLHPSFRVWRFLVWLLLFSSGVVANAGLHAGRAGLDVASYGTFFVAALALALAAVVNDMRIWRSALAQARSLPDRGA